MSSTFGLLPTGWTPKPAETIATEVDEGLRSIVGNSAGTEPDGSIPAQSFAGQLAALVAGEVEDLWDKLTAVAASFDPSSATDFALDNVASITGTIRDPAEYSFVQLTLAGSAGTTVAAGKSASVVISGAQFATNVPATLAAVDPWFQSLPYAVGNTMTNGGNVYVCTIGGTSAATGSGPSGTGDGIVDGGATWDFVGTGTAAVVVQATATVPGPLEASRNTITQISTPVSGWSGVSNAFDAVVGQSLESDPIFRVRRDQEAQASGNATTDAIRSAVLAVNQGSTDPAHQPVQSVNILHNDGDTIDSNGLPPHSVECIVSAPNTPALDIATAIWDSVAAGINTVGTTSTNVVDSQGATQVVRWTLAEPVQIYVTCTVLYDPAKWIAAGAGAAAQVEALTESALATYGASFPTGQSVRGAQLTAQIVDGPAALNADGTPNIAAPPGSPAIPGVVDVTPFFFGASPSPSTSTPVAITIRQVAIFSTANMIVTAAAENP
jgi:uncharacterized phage protein gp47/JayE